MCAPGLDKLLWPKNIAQTKDLCVNGMWQYGTIDDDNDDEDGEEPLQAGEGLVPLIPHHGQMFGFQALQEGLSTSNFVRANKIILKYKTI